MIAVCFQCGSPKSGPMTKCEFCQKKPVHHRDRVVSMALSNECLSEKNLKIGSQYIKEKKRLPKFHKKVALKAAQLMESYIEVDDGRNSDSIDLSSAFFQFEFDAGEQGRPKFVTVHCIGKPANLSDTEFSQFHKKKTYHALQWEVGNEITQEQVSANQDDDGDVYIWYRWISNSWHGKFVPKAEFEQIKSVEL